MKLHQLATGIATGYVSKGVQLLVSLLMVPFFLREEVLGLDGYGRAFTVSALTGMLPLLTGGLGYSLIRSLSRSLDERGAGPQPHEIMGAGLKILGSVCGLAAAATLLAAPWILPGVGLEVSMDVVGALAISGLIYVAEGSFNFLRTPLVARGSIAFVNGSSAAEVVLRAATYLIVFQVWPATLTLFFAIQMCFTGLRGAAQFLYLRRHWPEDLRGAWAAPWSVGRSAIGHSWPIAIHMGALTAIYRLPILLANRFLGPEASGLAAIALVTLRGYVLQTLFAVVQPISIPLASRVDPRQLSEHRRALLGRLEAGYVLVSVGITVVGVVLMPELIALWLGTGYEALVLAAQAVLVAAGGEVAFYGRTSLLIGQGFLGRAVPGIVGGTVIAALLSVLALVHFESWPWSVLGACLYFPLTTRFGIDAAYRRELLPSDGGRRGWPLLFVLSSGAVAWALSAPEFGRGGLALVMRMVGAGLAVAVLAHFLLISLREAVATLHTLRGSLDRSVVGDGSQNDSGTP